MERWDLYDRQKNKTGETHQRGLPLPPDRYHLVIHFWIKNDAGEYLIQKRSDTVDRRPGIWSFTGGSAVAGETSEQAVYREVWEEIGIEINTEEITMIHHYYKKDYFVDVYLLEKEVSIEMFSVGEEVAEVKYVSKKEIEKMREEGLFEGIEDGYFEKLFL